MSEVAKLKLSAAVWKRTSLSAGQRKEMFDLMAAHYDEVAWPRFLNDLSGKDEVILLQGEGGKIWGFSTLAWNPGGWDGGEDFVFSGDTIIAREAWGSQELVKAFCRRAGVWQAERGRKLFWLLISKGHRTYLYLPLFARRFFPSPEQKDADLARLTDSIATRVFPDSWNGDGVLRFAESCGQLKPDLAEAARSRDANRFVRFFLEANPGYRTGDELVCLAELSEENLKRSAKTAFLEGRSR